MYIPRLLESKARQLASFFPVVLVTGARQTGKTTMLRHAFADYEYVSLDLPSMAEQAERAPAEFLAEHPPPVLIDEVQYAPSLFRHLKYVVDQERGKTGRFILTGSQKLTLMEGVGDSLAGRCAWLELEGLAHDEIAQADAAPEGWATEAVRGAYPELWRLRDMPRRAFYQSYVATYLERDVRQLLNVRNLRDFERFIRIAASRSGQELNKSTLSNEVGVSVKAIGDWLSVLEATNVICILEPWYRNFSKRLVKTPKLYFRDTGLLCFLLGLDASTLLNSPFLGSVWESWLFAEMRKLNAMRETPLTFWFYRDQRQREVDFLLEGGGELHFLECKWAENLRARDARSLVVVREDMMASNEPLRPGKAWVVGNPEVAHPLADGVEAVNAGVLRGWLRDGVGA